MAIENLEQKIAQKVDKKSSTWKQDAEWRRANRSWLNKSASIAMYIIDRMDELGWSQKKLAEELGTTPQYVSKLCKGHENLTLKNIDALERILGIDILSDNKEVTQDAKTTNVHFTQAFDFLLKSIIYKLLEDVHIDTNTVVGPKMQISHVMRLNPNKPNTVKPEVGSFAMSA